ncbi:FAD-dependent oxidoreductase, partial [Mesorhizobium sp. M7A.T.Ca.TU.009.01.1.1]
MQLPEKDIRWRSHWLRQALPEDPDLAPPLEETTQADICIVGGGYLGLWTAIRLKQHNPGFDVVIVERDICGGGPSGRNSGMVLSAWTKYSALAALRDGNDALSIIKASEAAIGGIEAFCQAEAIDAWFDRIGWIWGATCEAQLGAWD